MMKDNGSCLEFQAQKTKYLKRELRWVQILQQIVLRAQRLQDLAKLKRRQIQRAALLLRLADAERMDQPLQMRKFVRTQMRDGHFDFGQSAHATEIMPSRQCGKPSFGSASENEVWQELADKTYSALDDCYFPGSASFFFTGCGTFRGGMKPPPQPPDPRPEAC